MAGTDEKPSPPGDDALYVLTAVLLTPAKFPSVLGDDYPEACAALGLAPLADGYGLVLGQDGEGARWTVVIDDVSLVAVAIASWDCGMEYDLSPDERTVVAALPGWPLAVAVAAPGVPAPHDPDPDGTDRPTPARPAGHRPSGGRPSGGWAPTRSRSSGRCGASRSTTRRSPARTASSGDGRRRRPRPPRRDEAEPEPAGEGPGSRRPACPGGGPRLRGLPAAARPGALVLRPGRRADPAGRRSRLVAGGQDRRHRVRPAGRGAGRGPAGGPRARTAGSAGSSRQDGRTARPEPCPQTSRLVRDTLHARSLRPRADEDTVRTLLEHCRRRARGAHRASRSRRHARPRRTLLPEQTSQPSPSRPWPVRTPRAVSVAVPGELASSYAEKVSSRRQGSQAP